MNYFVIVKTNMFLIPIIDKRIGCALTWLEDHDGRQMVNPYTIRQSKVHNNIISITTHSYIKFGILKAHVRILFFTRVKSIQCLDQHKNVPYFKSPWIFSHGICNISCISLRNYCVLCNSSRWKLPLMGAHGWKLYMHRHKKDYYMI